jgi:prepilin signal peptidase PulO-like enzyme (type II secretory pathway)
MRSNHKAAELRQAAELERLLEHPRGQAILEASSGDVAHALRILDAIGERDRPLAEVVSLPRTPILDFADLYDQELDAGLELEQRGPFPFVLALALGLLVWLVLAAIAFGLYELALRWPA